MHFALKEQYLKVIIEGDYKEVMDGILKASKNASCEFAKLVEDILGFGSILFFHTVCFDYKG